MVGIGVDVDKPGRQIRSHSVNNFVSPIFRETADGGNLVVFNQNIGFHRLPSGAVKELDVFDKNCCHVLIITQKSY